MNKSKGTLNSVRIGTANISYWEDAPNEVIKFPIELPKKNNIKLPVPVFKESPKQEYNQFRHEEALAAIGELVNSLSYYAFGSEKPIIAGGFARDTYLKREFDDIDIYVPAGFGVTRFQRHLTSITGKTLDWKLLTPVEKTKRDTEKVEELEDKLLDAYGSERQEIYEALLAIDVDGRPKYNPVNGLKLVFSFNFKGFKFNLMLMDHTEKAFVDLVMDSFCVCLAKAYLDLSGEFHYTPRFLQAVESKTVLVRGKSITSKYMKKVLKYFPEYTYLETKEIWNDETRQENKRAYSEKSSS